MLRRRTPRAAVLLILPGLLAIACGSDDGRPNASAAPAAAASSPGASASGAPLASDSSPASSGTAEQSPAATGTGATNTGGGGAPGTGEDVSIPDLVDQVSPSVVAILREDGGEGSGVVWSEDGVIVTNNHVVEGLNEVTVAYADGQRDSGVVEATDPRSDLAIVRVERDGLPAATFRDELPRVGELALAIGNPLGFEESVTAGIISGLGRSIPGTAATTSALTDLVQTDAPISPGNSGGALVGSDGEIIGINVAYLPPEGGAVSIGFAIPAPTAVDVVEQLLEDGQVVHAYMGIRPATLDIQTARAYDLPVDAGAVLIDVVASGPAADAGLEPGDIVVGLDGERVESAEDLLTLLRRHAPDDDVEVRVVRPDGQETTVPVTLGELPA
jgi:S1-C subfamily serine protease